MRSLAFIGSMAAICTCLLAGPASSAVLTQGNLLAAYADRIYEVTTTGSIVQSFHVPVFAPFSLRTMGDLVYDPTGKIHVRINSAGDGACCESLISTFDVATESWNHTEVSNYNSGGYDLELAKLGHKLFTERIQFDLNTRTSVAVRPKMHFFDSTERAEGITLGRDGSFYATSNLTAAAVVYRIDPTTYEQVGSGLITNNPFDSLDVHGIAVKENGDYFVVGFEGEIFSFTAAQQFVKKSVATGPGPSDLSLSKEGILAFGQRSVGDTGGMLTFFNEQLDVLGQVRIGSRLDAAGIYTAFIEVPEPGSATYWIATLAGMIIAVRLRR